ncbi:MAG: cysteine methyltransferase [Planctomycetes bacterium SCN 63-9]|nr:MAG: cysteine methyltransferase [Planctomycetes bacterium SCN 63-9]
MTVLTKPRPLAASSCYSLHPSPIGELILTSDGKSLTGLYMRTPRHGDDPRSLLRHDDGPFQDVRRQLDEYFEGERAAFDVPLSPTGTPFQRRVWEELSRIPYGSTISYAELARRVGNAGASRAVGSANGRNPISIIVPCHRVIASDGGLGGFGGGLERKEWLLSMESGVLRRSEIIQ